MAQVEFSDRFPSWLEDAQYLLLPEEVKEIDRDVRRIVYRSAVAEKIFGTKNIPAGLHKWDVHYATQPSAPIFSLDFLPESMDKVDKEVVTHYLTGISKDYFISMKDIDASRSSSYLNDKIDTLHLREITALVADFKERVWWRGYDILGADPGSINTNVVGIVTASGINSFLANGTAAKLGTAGDGLKGVSNAVGELVIDKYQPPFDTVMTPYVYAQLALNRNSTTFETDIEGMHRMVAEDGVTKLIRNVHLSEHLLNAADDGSASAWVFIAPKNIIGEPTVELLTSYPVWHYPITTNTLGIQGKVLCMVGAAPVRADGVCFEDAIDVDGV